MHLSLKLKLIIGTLLLIIISSFSGIAGYNGMMNTKESLSLITEKYMPRIESLNTLPYHFQSIMLAQTMLLKRNITEEQRKQQYTIIQHHREVYSSILKQLENIPKDYSEKALWNKFTDTLTEARRENNKIFDMIKEWESTPNDTDLYQKAFDYCYTAGNRINAQLFNEILEIIAHTKENSNTAKATALSDIETDTRYIFITYAIALLVGISISIFIVQKISVPLRKILHAAQIFSQGDFNTRLIITSKDEIGETSKYLNKALDTVVDKLHWYENVLNSITFPIIVVSPDKYITYLNDHAIKTFHLDKDIYLGKSCVALGSTICNDVDCSITQIKKGKSQCHFKMMNLPELDYKMDVSILTNRHGDTIGYIELIQDITEVNKLKKAAEDALKEGILQAAHQLNISVKHIVSTTTTIASQIEQSTGGSETQATQMGETAAAMEEMSASILEVAKNTSDTSGAALSAKQKAHEGTQIVQNIINSIDHIREVSDTLKKDIHVLGERVDGINDIITTISHIADQTNLLALNAAVVGARSNSYSSELIEIMEFVNKLVEALLKNEAIEFEED